MKFRTQVEIALSDKKIDYDKSLFFIGSCFTDSIGNKFYDNFFNCVVNPFGVLYNPLSIASALNILIDEKKFTSKDLIFDKGLWHSFSHHSTFSGSDKIKVLDKINSSREYASNFLKQTDFLFITFGTSWVYELKENKKIVANCHKFPAQIFNRRLLKVEEIVEEFSHLIEKLSKLNPDLQIIFTVSPVRHLKDGASGNNLSKSVLFVAINELMNKYTNLLYFPSYEIVMDELRDYRFYASDMIHISDMAVEYIWEKLSDSFFDKQTKEDLKKAVKLGKLLSHRPMNKSSEDYNKYISLCEKTVAQVTDIGKKINKGLIEKRFDELKNY